MALVKSIVSTVKPNFAIFLKYAKVELTPPGPGDIPAIGRGIADLLSAAKTSRWRQLTVKEAWLNTLVFTEVCCWFFVGEVIGKRNVVGYNEAWLNVLVGTEVLCWFFVGECIGKKNIVGYKVEV